MKPKRKSKRAPELKRRKPVCVQRPVRQHLEAYDYEFAQWFCKTMNKKLKPKRKLSHPWRNDVIGNHCSNKANRKKALAEVKRRAKLIAAINERTAMPLYAKT